MSTPTELVDRLLKEDGDPIRPGRDVYVWTKFFEDGDRSFWQVYVGIPPLEAPHRTFNARRLNSAIQALANGEEVKVWDRNFSGAQKSAGGLRINVVNGRMGAKQDDNGGQVLLQKVQAAIANAGYRSKQR